MRYTRLPHFCLLRGDLCCATGNGNSATGLGALLLCWLSPAQSGAAYRVFCHWQLGLVELLFAQVPFVHQDFTLHQGEEEAETRAAGIQLAPAGAPCTGITSSWPLCRQSASFNRVPPGLLWMRLSWECHLVEEIIQCYPALLCILFLASLTHFKSLSLLN